MNSVVCRGCNNSSNLEISNIQIWGTGSNDSGISIYKNWAKDSEPIRGKDNGIGAKVTTTLEHTTETDVMNDVIVVSNEDSVTCPENYSITNCNCISLTNNVTCNGSTIEMENGLHKCIAIPSFKIAIG